jgi:hypothetical protein
MPHLLPHLSQPDGCCVAPRLAAVAAVALLEAVAALVVVFAMTLAAPSQS